MAQSRLKKHPGFTNEDTPCTSFSPFHSPTGHLEFHCQISLGPCVWAPESCKDHIALPLQTRIHTHKHTHTQAHTCTEALKGGPWQNPHHPCDLRPISTYLVILVILLLYRLCSYNSTSISIHPLLMVFFLPWQHLWWCSATTAADPPPLVVRWIHP